MKRQERLQNWYLKGKAYWLTEDLPNTLYGNINESDEPIEVMVIEIKALEQKAS